MGESAIAISLTLYDKRANRQMLTHVGKEVERRGIRLPLTEDLGLYACRNSPQITPSSNFKAGRDVRDLIDVLRSCYIERGRVICPYFLYKRQFV